MIHKSYDKPPCPNEHQRHFGVVRLNPSSQTIVVSSVVTRSTKYYMVTKYEWERRNDGNKNIEIMFTIKSLGSDREHSRGTDDNTGALS